MDFSAVIFKYLGDSLTLVKNLSENLNKQSKRIEELEEKLRVNSQNSSKPPSIDFNKKKKKKFHTKKSNDKPGGQPGHKGSLPEGFSYYCLGPNAISTIANLISRFRLSRQKVVEFFKEFFDIKISKGTVSNHEKIISNAIQPCYDDLLKKIKKEPVVHADEATHIESNKKQWAWIGVSDNITKT